MSQDWFWEGNILGAFTRYLERQGWQVVPMAQVEQGLELAARRDGRELLVEVRGYPPAPPARGPSPRAGQPRATRMSSKARQWYAHALLGVMLKHHAHPDAEIALALPAHRTYQSLVDQTARALTTLGVGVFLVSANGDVETLLEL
ncbi:MAG: hypothetical protein ACRDYA_10025 [Egibacteraceae bacterium]